MKTAHDQLMIPRSIHPSETLFSHKLAMSQWQGWICTNLTSSGHWTTYHHSDKENSRQPSFSGGCQLQVTFCRIEFRGVSFYWSHLLRARGRRCRGSQRHHWHLPSRRWMQASSGNGRSPPDQGLSRSRGHPRLAKQIGTFYTITFYEAFFCHLSGCL